MRFLGFLITLIIKSQLSDPTIIPDGSLDLHSVLPAELHELARSSGKMIEFNLEDHRKEDYKAPKPKLKPFAGKGNSLNK